MNQEIEVQEQSTWGPAALSGCCVSLMLCSSGFYDI